MKLVSINIAQSKTVLFDGRKVSTGIFKEPVAMGAFIEKLGFIGDEQVDQKNHGGVHKAVYAFSSNHYDYWRSVLKNSDLTAGSFGENLTISDFCEEVICIGDVVKVGDALLEVSQPRIPCFKLGIALGNNSAPKLFLRNYATGVYFRVLETGAVNPDSEITVIEKSQHGVSVKSLLRAYYDREYVDADQIVSKAVTHEKLAPEWKNMLEKRLRKKVSVLDV